MSRWCAWGVVAACVVIAIIAPGPDRYQRSAISFHDFLHVPGFAIVASALYFAIPAQQGLRRKGRMITIGALAVAIGALVELAQMASGGSAEFGDIVGDAGGAALAALMASSLDKAHRLWVRRSAGIAALGVAAVFLSPTLADLIDEALARRQFPILAEFAMSSELNRFRFSREARASLVTMPSSAGPARALRLELEPGLYPGLSFQFFPRDWRGWQEFILVCTNQESAPIRLTLRIDDMEHNENYGDRYNRSFDIAPGRHEIRAPLREVEAAPAGRILDLGRVRSVVLFAHRLQEERELLIHSVRLAR
jgi:hypothetical protein